MTQNFNSNSQLPSEIPTPQSRTAKPSPEFYSIFSEEELLGIIQALELNREIPLKYSYKGRGATIWDTFYLKNIIPKWYRPSSVEIDLLKQNFAYINGNFQGCRKLNIIDVGSGNSYPVKEFMKNLIKMERLNQYIALDISEELLTVSRKNFQRWFPLIEYSSYIIDIENSCIPQIFLKNQDDYETLDTANLFLHLGVTIGNHRNRTQVFKNFIDSMGKNDFLVFTNEIGSNSQWDGIARGGCKYHAEEIYQWIKSQIGIRAEDCELVRKYDLATDSIIANIKLLQNYTLNFKFLEIDKNIDLSKGEEITIWRHHKFEIPELLQEIEQAGLQLVHYSTNKYSSHIMVVCKLASK
ncbi:hypothetical protein NIES4103_36730 [Nostoc sp. NIES-4103]|nr:hypothetical protein NIES4103_36730 [Nostoc sp. NIES-4103]